ncbi:2-oxo acid dehydrogenase subunit E2 [Microbacterium bovistercoris]|uniref:Dihydrolipoamide acetyltransferase component of pyruvate dehydrogenase complex n=1 Tax=Microbacterium bovistercoris TaxID=2293570 RepID=A0A371NSL6_9MICO|nr:dihydrolipoamide acetyltransferase family protein [Microbacterium bovistercoris]REJ05234.1 2-oxo acid dehydrogenase subunit E2 [Microbacterium bovistercoris]
MSVATARVFRLPDLGEGLTEAGLVQWLVAVGDTVTVDQPIAEVETAKSVVELPTPFAGVVTALHGAEGDTIAVGAPVLEVEDPRSPRERSETKRATAPEASHDVSSAHPEGASPNDQEGDATLLEAHRREEQAGSGNVLIGYGTPERAGMGRRRRPSARRSAKPSEITDQTDAARRAAAGHAAPAPARPSDPTRPVAVRNPIVRRLARDLGLDVHTITPTGVDGAVTRADVLRAAVDKAVDHAAAAHAASTGAAFSSAAPSAPGSAASASGDPSGLAIRSQEPLSPLRRAASATLSRSRAEIPEATVWVDVDATELWNARKAMAPEGGRAPSMTALLARFTLLALEDFPILASRLSPDATELTVFDGVSLGIAADTPRGLIVPVIPHAHAMDLDSLDAAVRDAADAARAGILEPSRMRGSTFTLNNYGSLGVDGSAAIINPPNVAIFGIGRMIERPWVVDGQIVPRRIAQLSLVFDHRVCDGGYASGFLRRVTELIEHPLRAFGKL